MTMTQILFVGPMLGRNAGIVPNPAEALAPYLLHRGYGCRLTSPILNRYLRLMDIAYTIIRARKWTDILFIQVYTGPSFVVEDVASLIGRALGHRMVMMLHGGAMPQFIARFPHWTKRVLSRADVLIAPSAYLAQAIVASGLNAQVIPNAIDLGQYPFRQRTSLSPRLLWMRAFHEIYNPAMAIHVLAALQTVYPGATLTMAGQEKGLLSEMKDIVHNLGLADRVRFVGFLDQAGKQHEFSTHDIFLNTSRIDNMPISLIEASAFGMPLVTTSIGGIPQMFTHEQNALLVPNEDVSAMTQSVIRLLQDESLAGRLSQNARSWADQFDWIPVVDRWEDVFTQVMNGH